MKKLHGLYHYLSTSVRAEIRGTSPERFLNLCARHEIDVWGIEYREPNCLRISMPGLFYPLRRSRGAVPAGSGLSGEAACIME